MSSYDKIYTIGWYSGFYSSLKDENQTWNSVYFFREPKTANYRLPQNFGAIYPHFEDILFYKCNKLLGKG